MKEFTIGEKMLMQWFGKPEFLRQFKCVTHFLEQVKELDLIIGAKHGATLLTEQHLQKPGEQKDLKDAIKLAPSAPKTARAKRPKLKRLSHPSHSPDKVRRMLRALVDKEGAASDRRAS
jgi:hypothetical protein